MGSSYPEGNFRGNLLLDGSITLSPPIPMSDERFACQYRFEPPLEFSLASPRSGLAHYLRVLIGMLQLKPLTEDQGQPAVCPVRNSRSSASLCILGFKTRLLTLMSDSLGPCFKTG
jgi:hypothetical protein